jgi:hypothetical protein
MQCSVLQEDQVLRRRQQASRQWSHGTITLPWVQFTDDEAVAMEAAGLVRPNPPDLKTTDKFGTSPCHANNSRGRQVVTELLQELEADRAEKLALLLQQEANRRAEAEARYAEVEADWHQHDYEMTGRLVKLQERMAQEVCVGPILVATFEYQPSHIKISTGRVWRTRRLESKSQKSDLQPEWTHAQVEARIAAEAAADAMAERATAAERKADIAHRRAAKESRAAAVVRTEKSAADWNIKRSGSGGGGIMGPHPEQQAEPPSASSYHVMEEAVIRDTFSHNTRAVGQLHAGDTIHPLERRWGLKGETWLRCEAGWVALSDGHPTGPVGSRGPRVQCTYRCGRLQPCTRVQGGSLFVLQSARQLVVLRRQPAVHRRRGDAAGAGGSCCCGTARAAQRRWNPGVDGDPLAHCFALAAPPPVRMI